MRTTITQLLTAFIILIFATFPAQSQMSHVPGSLKKTDQTGQDAAAGNFAEIMRNAAESGVQVIVVNTHGKPLSQPIVTEGENSENAGGMSNLMSFQVSVVEFRKTLLNRLQALPGSFVEVILY